MIWLIIGGLAVLILLDDDENGKGVKKSNDQRTAKNGGNSDVGDIDSGQRTRNTKRNRLAGVKKAGVKNGGKNDGQEKKKGNKKTTGGTEKGKKSSGEKKEEKKKVEKKKPTEKEKK